MTPVHFSSKSTPFKSGENDPRFRLIDPKAPKEYHTYELVLIGGVSFLAGMVFALIIATFAWTGGFSA